MDQQATSYVQLQAALDLAGLELRASEVHGMVCGEACRRLTSGPDLDFFMLLGGPEPADGAARMVLELVRDLMAQTWQTLDAGSQFDLLLPEDDEPIEERTASLAEWARGFVLALFRGDGAGLGELHGDSGEFVRDVMKISEARPGGNAEEDERALVEIEEYIRVGVQLVFEELQPDPGPEMAGAAH